MKIQLLSDLHNEFLRSGKQVDNHSWSGVIPQTDADIIILAGDIDTGTKGAEWAISESKRLGKTILYVLGNHEFYRHEYFSVKEKIESLCAGTSVYCLDSGEFTIEGVRFLGTTLWTDYEADVRVPQDLAMFYIDKNLTDHRIIKFKSGSAYSRFKPQHALAFHRKELNWLRQQLDADFDGKTIVITHHGPHALCQHPSFPVSEMSGAFHSNLESLIKAHDIDVWAFGHTHANLDTVIYDTRIVSNQAGYPGENVSNFEAGFIIELTL